MGLFETLSPEGTPIYLANYPVEKGSGRVGHEWAHSEAELQKFIASYDRPGRGLYFTVARLKSGTTRCKENVEATNFIWADIDFKDHPDITPEEIRRRVEAAPLPPTLIVASGHGLHLYWELHEAVDAMPGPAQQEVEEALKLACNYVGGDTSAAEIAKVLRLPGSHNRKNGEDLPVSIVASAEHRYELSDLVDFWLEAQPVIPAPIKAKEAGGGSHADTEGEYKTPIDIDARLAAMQFRGSGDSAINVTRTHVCAAMLARNIGVEEIVRTVLEATRRCVAGRPESANWRWTPSDPGKGECEEQLIWESCVNFIVKHPNRFAGLLPDKLRRQLEASLAAGKRPKLSRNAAGWHLRGYSEHIHSTAGDAANETNKETDSEQASGANKETNSKQAPGGRQVLKLRAFTPFDVAKLPPREWLYGKHYQRRTVSLTAGPGGMGKSSLDMVEAVAMATCRNLLGEQPEERLRVWYHNGEDPLDEINRRLAAICQHYDIPQEELQDHLWVTSGNEFPLRVAKGYANLEIDTGLVRQISAAIGDNQIDLAIFDPFVTLHAVSEVDAGKMDAVLRLFAGIGDENGASIEIAHHVRKPAAGMAADYDVHDIRGVTAITDAVRAARVLNRMNERDAEAAGCAEFERLSRFRVDRAKGNYSPAQAATWRQFVNVTLANGDDVGVVAPWDFPGQGEQTPEKTAADQKAEHVFVQLLNKFLARGQNVSPNPGPDDAPAKFAEEREAKTAKVAKAALKAAMARLLDANRIMVELTGRGDRYSRLVPCQGAPPEMTV